MAPLACAPHASRNYMQSHQPAAKLSAYRTLVTCLARGVDLSARRSQKG